MAVTRGQQQAEVQEEEEEEEESGAQAPAVLTEHNLSKELYRVPPLFTRDGNGLVITAGKGITVLSTTTGEVIHKLDEVHGERVVSLSLGPNPGRLYSASCEGLICGWDCLEKTEAQWSFNFGRELLSMTASSTDPGIVYACIRKTPLGHKHEKFVKGEELWFKFVELNMKTPKQQQRMLLQGRPLLFQDVLDFVVVATSRQLIVWSKKEQAVFSELKFNWKEGEDESLVVVAVDPARRSVATADVRGRVFIYHSLFDAKTQFLAQSEMYTEKGKKGDARRKALRKLESGQLRSEMIKWHAHGVMCMAFSPEGTHLISGGEEGVLVVSQVGTKARTFLPGLGAALCTISHHQDSTACAITTRANKLMLINPVDLRVRWEYRGVGLRPFNPRQPDLVDMSRQVKMWASHGHGGDLVINAREGSLQFLDLASEMVVKELEVVQYNRVAWNGDDEVITPPWVTQCALSPLGLRLATIDVRVGEDDLKKMALKFWDHDEANRRYFLAGCVENPHDADICGLAYHPRSDMVASCSTDGAFKLWTMELLPSGEPRWSCHARVTYRPNRITSLSFSEDGSVLAVSYGSLLTLWDPQMVRVLGTIQASTRAKPIKEVHFLPYGPHLVTVCKRSVAVWDALSLERCWQFEGEIAAVAVTPANREGRLLEMPGGERVDFVVATKEEASPPDAPTGPQPGGDAEALKKQKEQEQQKQTKQKKKKKGDEGQGEPAQPPAPIQVVAKQGTGREMVVGNRPQHAIHFFSVASAKPLHTQHVHRFVDGLAVVLGPQTSGVAHYSRRMGLRLLTTAAPTKGQPQQLEAGLSKTAVVSGLKRPLPKVELARAPGSSKARRLEDMSFAGAKTTPLSDLLDASTSTLPAPSTLFNSFLQGLLPTNHTAPNPSSAPTPLLPPPPPRVEKKQPQTPSKRRQGSQPHTPQFPQPAPPEPDRATEEAHPTDVPVQACGIRKEFLQLFSNSFSGS